MWRKWGVNEASNLISSYTGWFFILPVHAFAFCSLGGVAGALTEEGCYKKIVMLNISHVAPYVTWRCWSNAGTGAA